MMFLFYVSTTHGFLFQQHYYISFYFLTLLFLFSFSLLFLLFSQSNFLCHFFSSLFYSTIFVPLSSRYEISILINISNFLIIAYIDEDQYRNQYQYWYWLKEIVEVNRKYEKLYATLWNVLSFGMIFTEK